MRRVLTGLNAWLIQRITAVYLLGFIVFLCLHFMLDSPPSYAQWREWVRAPGVSTAALLFFAAILIHAWVGLRDVILDYVHPSAARITALALSGFGIAAMAAWVLQIMLR